MRFPWARGLAVLGAVVCVAVVASQRETKASGSCLIPKSWGQLRSANVQGAAVLLSFEATDGTIRFILTNECGIATKLVPLFVVHRGE